MARSIYDERVNVQKFMTENPQYADAYNQIYQHLKKMMTEGDGHQCIHYRPFDFDPEYDIIINVPEDPTTIPYEISKFLEEEMFDVMGEEVYILMIPKPEDFFWE